MTTIRSLVLFGLVLFLFSSRCATAQVDWEPASGAPIGDINSFAAMPNGDILAGSDVGLFRSSDTGITWARVSSFNFYGASYIGVSASGHIFAGSERVYRSIDDGISWASITSGLGDTAYSIGLRQIVAGPGSVLFVITDSGIFRSSDEGDDWTFTTPGISRNSCEGICIAPNGHLFASIYGSGLLRSTDLGQTWRTSDSGISNLSLISVVADSDGRLYTSSAFVSNPGIFSSSDDGVSWTKIDSTRVGRLLLGSRNNLLVHTYSDGFMRSEDKGATWSGANAGLHFDNNQNIIWTFSYLFDRLFVAVRGEGYFVSTNFGISWSPGTSFLVQSSIGPIVQDTGGTLFVGALGPESNAMYRSTDSGKSWASVDIGVPNPSVVTLMSEHGQTFAAVYGGLFRSSDAGATWMRADSGLAFQIGTSRQYHPVGAMVIAPNGLLYAGTNEGGLFRSTNDGNIWSHVNLGIKDSSIFPIAVDSMGVIYAGLWPGSAAGTIIRSTDDGDTWTIIDSALSRNLPTYDTIGVRSLAIGKSGVIFAGADHLYRSSDGGSTWVATDSSVVLALAVDAKGIVYASSDKGVMRSFDNGLSWRVINSGLTTNQVFSISVGPSGIYVGSYDKGVFRGVPSSLSTVVNSDVISNLNLLQCSPNPVTHRTSINFTVPEASLVMLKLFDMTGREVAVIANGFFDAGEHSVTFDRGSLPAGVYCYRLQTGTTSAARMMVLLP